MLIAAFIVSSATLAPANAQGAATAEATASAEDSTPKIVTAVNAFVATLTDAQKATALFDFNSNQKSNWSNFPSPFYKRNGLRLADMTQAQQDSAMAIVATVLSKQGYQKVIDIMNADEAFKALSGGGGGAAMFGKDQYYIDFIGVPSTTTPWILQFGGHHLAINATIAGSNITISPTLTGNQPGSYTLNGVTVIPLNDEFTKASKLVTSLDAAQQKQAILGYQQTDLILGPGQDGKVTQQEGIKASALNADQQAMLLDVVSEWTNILNDEDAAVQMATIKANFADTTFAWSGPTAANTAAYYRIQGPTVIIEFAPQGSGQGGTGGSLTLDHVHTIYRDPTNEYGAAYLK